MKIISKIVRGLVAAALAVSVAAPSFAAALTVQSAVVEQNLTAGSGQVKISTLTFSKAVSQIYTGKEIKPSITVKNGGKKLVNGTDYTVSYKNNKEMGTASIVITGKGKYTGTKEISFKIIPGSTALSVRNDGGKLTFSWDKVKGADGYQINYSVDGGGFKKLASTAVTRYSTSKLNAGSYKFKVRAYKKVNGKTYYGGFSDVVSITVTEQAAITDSASRSVWIPTNGGKKYHSNPSCSNMIDPIQVSIERAVAEGFTACKKCY